MKRFCEHHTEDKDENEGTTSRDDSSEEVRLKKHLLKRHTVIIVTDWI